MLDEEGFCRFLREVLGSSCKNSKVIALNLRGHSPLFVDLQRQSEGGYSELIPLHMEGEKNHVKKIDSQLNFKKVPNTGDLR